MERDVYFFLCTTSGFSVFLFIAIGNMLSFRPGAPSISRMLSDATPLYTFFYIIVVSLTNVLKTIVLSKMQSEGKKSGISNYIIFTSIVQTISLILIPFADLDTAATLHYIIAGISVVTTILLQVLFLIFHPSRSRWVNITYALLTGFIGVIGGIYIIVVFLVEHIEKHTYISLVEYSLFILMAFISIFNVML